MRNMLIFLIVVVIVIAVGTYFYVMMSKHIPAPATPPATNSLAPATPGTQG